jgi:hypothetical protein
MLRRMRDILFGAFFILAFATVGAAVGVIVEFPNLIRGMFEPQAGTGLGVLGGCCAGVMIGTAVLIVQRWNRIRSN